MNSNKQILFFDGDCGFCNFWVWFIIKRDKSGVFLFSSLQSEAANQLLSTNFLKETFDSIVLLKKNSCFVKSSAIIEILQQLPGLWKILWVLKFIPLPFRDFVYDVVAKNRSRIKVLKLCDIRLKNKFSNRFL